MTSYVKDLFRPSAVKALRNRLVDVWTRRMPKNVATRRAAVGAGILFLSVLASASIFATGPSASPEVKKEKAWPVSIITIEPGAMAPMFNVFGRVEATRVAHIQTDLVAEIRTVLVREGEFVKQGDVLITLDADALELAQHEREAELARERAVLARIETERKLISESTDDYESMYDISRKKLKRHEELMAKRMISQALLDDATEQAAAAAIAYQNHRLALADFPNRIAEQQARVAQATSTLDRARLNLAHATLYAPFSGPVLKVTASPGNHTVMGQALVEVADAQGLELRAAVPDAYTSSVRRHLASGERIDAVAELDGTEVRLVLARLGGSVRTGQSGLDAFYRVDAPADAETISADESPLAIGRVLNLSVRLPEERDVVALPVQSLYENDRIYAVEDDRLKAVTIERVGDHQTAAGEYRVLVRSPELTTGRRVITTQLPKAISGLRVAPVG